MEFRDHDIMVKCGIAGVGMCLYVSVCVGMCWYVLACVGMCVVCVCMCLYVW